MSASNKTSQALGGTKNHVCRSGWKDYSFALQVGVVARRGCHGCVVLFQIVSTCTQTYPPFTMVWVWGNHLMWGGGHSPLARPRPPHSASSVFPYNMVSSAVWCANWGDYSTPLCPTCWQAIQSPSTEIKIRSTLDVTEALSYSSSWLFLISFISFWHHLQSKWLKWCYLVGWGGGENLIILDCFSSLLVHRWEIHVIVYHSPGLWLHTMESNLRFSFQLNAFRNLVHRHWNWGRKQEKVLRHARQHIEEN